MIQNDGVVLVTVDFRLIVVRSQMKTSGVTCVIINWLDTSTRSTPGPGPVLTESAPAFCEQKGLGPNLDLDCFANTTGTRWRPMGAVLDASPTNSPLGHVEMHFSEPLGHIDAESRSTLGRLQKFKEEGLDNSAGFALN